MKEKDGTRIQREYEERRSKKRRGDREGKRVEEDSRSVSKGRVTCCDARILALCPSSFNLAVHPLHVHARTHTMLLMANTRTYPDSFVSVYPLEKRNRYLFVLLVDERLRSPYQRDSTTTLCLWLRSTNRRFLVADEPWRRERIHGRE